MKLSNLFFTLPLLAVTFLSSAAFSAPQVGGASGQLEHGGQLEVFGSGFGSRGNFNNVSATWKGERFLAFRVKDFDDQSLSSGGFNNPGSSWILKQSGRHGAGYFASKYYNGQRLGALEANQQGTTGTWYMSFWFMMPSGTDSGKFFRIYGSGSAGNIYISTGGSSGRSIRGYSECTASECSTATVWNGPDSFGPGTWHRVEVLMQQSNNGRFAVYMDGKLQWARERWVATNPGAYNGHTIDIGNMIDAGSTSSENHSYNYDDIYLDFTQARVELGNAPTWSGCTHREVQVPLEWSDSRIAVAVNRGSFSEGSQAYLYVVDSQGNVNSSGYPVTIGGDVDEGSPPKPPAVSVE